MGRDLLALGDDLVERDKNGSAFPDSGQVVALIRQLDGRKFLELGLVKWAAIGRDDTPRCGIQRFHGNTRKISIRIGDELAAQRNGLLIIRNQNGEMRVNQLVAPAGSLKLQERALIQSVGQISQSEIRVDSLLLKTRNVDVFRVEVREA